MERTEISLDILASVYLVWYKISVQLARRVLQLEKLNSSLRQQLSEEQSKTTGLQEQVRHTHTHTHTHTMFNES